jgi:hypothetical protein
VSLSTASKDFKIKNGLIVQGSSATVDGNQILTTASDLDDLFDVNAPTPADGDALVYDSTTSKWIPEAVSGGTTDSFKTISVSGQDNVVADSSTDTLTLVAGSNVTITTNATTDSITLSATDTNTTYSVSAETVSGGANIRLTDSASTTDDVKIEGTGSVLVTRTDANTISINGVTDLSFNAQIASYTVVLLDKDKMIEMSNASPNTLTIPTDSIDFPVGSQISVMQTGAGQTSIVGDSGVTVVGTPGLNLRAQWSAATVVKRASNSWVAIGDLSE